MTADDCNFVRQTFLYEKFDEFTYPSADLQLEARSVEAVARGEYRWILAELHPPVALLHHGFYWSCPDKAALRKALAQTTKGCPSFLAEPPGDQIKREPENLDDVKSYVTNLAQWLAPD